MVASPTPRPALTAYWKAEAGVAWLSASIIDPIPHCNM